MKNGFGLMAALLPMMLVGAAAAADPVAPEAAGTAGTTIVGEREAAVGLYLLPWQEENRSELDRPPILYRGVSSAIDARHFADRVASDEAEAAHRRMRAEPRL